MSARVALAWRLLLLVQRMYDMGALSHRDAFAAGQWLAWTVLRVGHMGELWWTTYEQVSLVMYDPASPDEDCPSIHHHAPLTGDTTRTLWNNCTTEDHP